MSMNQMYDPSKDIRIKKLASTEQFAKIINYINSLMDDASYYSRIAELRKKYELPEDGVGEYIIRKSKYTGDDVICLPDHVDEVELRKDISNWVGQLGLGSIWSGLFENIVVYNKTDLHYSYLYSGLIDTMDVREHLLGPFTDSAEEEWMLDFLKESSYELPVSICVSPYATQRDIIDYIKKMYKTDIKPIQDAYKDKKIKLGKVRKRSSRVRARNKFIYENKHKSGKEIAQLVSKKFGDNLDYTYVNKIIKEIQDKLD